MLDVCVYVWFGACERVDAGADRLREVLQYLKIIIVFKLLFKVYNLLIIIYKYYTRIGHILVNINNNINFVQKHSL